MSHGAPLAAVLAVSLVGCGRGRADEPLRVAAASDLASTFPAIGAAYEAETGRRVVFTFGSSGRIARQIEEGAPFDVFASADARFVDDVVTARRCDGGTRALYARGRLAIVGAAGAPPPATLADLADPSLARIAIANPEHAPYGRAARQALEAAGVWDRLAGRVVFADSVLQARQLAEIGSADAAIVARSLVIDAPHAIVPDSAHPPLDQALVVCATAPRRAAAADFAAYVQRERARGILGAHGFVLPVASP